jgi:hypothetical protein
MPKKPFQIKDQQKQLRFSLHRNNWTNNFRMLPRCITFYFTSYYLEGQPAGSFQLTHAVTIKCNKYTVAPPPHTLTLSYHKNRLTLVNTFPSEKHPYRTI